MFWIQMDDRPLISSNLFQLSSVHIDVVVFCCFVGVSCLHCIQVTFSVPSSRLGLNITM